MEIPKKNGKMRLLGIPTIEDRVAQTVVKNQLEPKGEPIFLRDSYGYRPNKSALDAVGVTRERCYGMAWLIEYDIVGLFDRIDHAKMMKAVEKHAEEKWVRLYVRLFWEAPIVLPNGTKADRAAGTPQGGVISPVLANLFMHYAFDIWMRKYFPRNPWARYADDGIIHCMSEKQARYILDKLTERLAACGLEIHPEKTRIVYCRGGKFNERYANESFDFLGYTFRTRQVKSKDGRIFMGFTPAVSKSALKKFKEKIRDEYKNRKTTSIKKLAETLNPIIRGWMNYFMKYHPSEARSKGIYYVDQTLARFVVRNYKYARRSYRKAWKLLRKWACAMPKLFYHWEMGCKPMAG